MADTTDGPPLVSPEDMARYEAKWAREREDLEELVRLAKRDGRPLPLDHPALTAEEREDNRQANIQLHKRSRPSDVLPTWGERIAADMKKLFIWIAVIIAGIGLIYLWGKHHQHNVTPSASSSPNSGSAVLTADQAWNHIGDSATVQYQVGYATADSKGDEFLNQKQNYLSGFTAVIFASDLSTFQNDPEATYGGATIDVTGTIQSYEGHPEIVVNDPSQIAMAANGNAATTG
jgi:DNA/RNA endonuclease YhcR with UshA esterase domain